MTHPLHRPDLPPSWIGIHLPALALEAFAATLGPEADGLPLALLDGARIAAVDGVAAALGVQPGQRRATAQALAPQLLFGQADAGREAQALQAVAHAALQFTPAVTLHGPATVLLEVASTQRLFGGPAPLLTGLREALAPLRHLVHLACAPTALGAALLACWGRETGEIDPPGAPGSHAGRLARLRALLDQAPVGLLCTAPGQVEALQGMGQHTLADLRALPRAGLARRLGPALLDTLDRARGDAPDPQAWVVPPEVFESRLELFARADTSDQLLHGAGLLLARLVTWARARQGRVQRFTLAMQHERRHRADDATPAHTALEIAPARPSSDADHLHGLLRERLARLPLPAPTLELRLHCAGLARLAPPDGELFPTRESAQEGMARLVERLQARLGPARVQGLQRAADHRPERATRAAAWPPEGGLAPTRAGPGPDLSPSPDPGSTHLTRPVWLLAQAQRLQALRTHPLLEGRPLQLLAGPERIESGWWDGTPAARDYFVARAHDATLVWIYRSRLPASEADGGWFLHGRFG